ncbi:MAG TPA: Mov34/MPN/PAD-1 family protein [Solirubrobacteraceae bacterium]|jgi:integrative and conjugative element protein (TIGR02256 family)|nr:Mov34/MPN/PAD-1 family protein [Solirubrobacteraceae bacterium]
MEAVLAEATLMAPLETGGMLLGYRAGGAVVVQAVTGPGPDAKHHRAHFESDADWQQRELELIYEASGRVTTYLGDWHTHPSAPPIPSRRDRRTAQKVARTKEARSPTPLTAILGDAMDSVACVRLYEYREHQFRELGLTVFRTSA